MQTNQTKLNQVLNDPSIEMDEKRLLSTELEEKFTQLERTRHQLAQSHMATRNLLQGEMISKYWTQLNRAKTPRDKCSNTLTPTLLTLGEPQLRWLN
jgi:hypothetical protein